MYVFGHEKEDRKCRESITGQKRLSSSCGRLTYWFDRDDLLRMTVTTGVTEVTHYLYGRLSRYKSILI